MRSPFFSYAKKLLLIMKLITVILILTTLQISAGGYSQDVNLKLDFQNGTISDLIQAIETQSDFRIFYKTDQVNVNQGIVLPESDGTIAEVLNAALSNSDISYLVMDRLIILTKEPQVTQQLKVTGTITDAATGEPLPGVYVLIEGTEQGAVTDGAGRYSVQVPSATSVLIFSYVGYNTETIQVAGQTVIDVSMVLNIQSLDEVVVIGYGTRKKSDLTGAISTVTSKELNKEIKMSPEMAMQGKMPGVLISNTGSSPIARPVVRIRGVGTLGYNDPLYVVDGIPVTEGGASSSSDRDRDIRGPINIFNMIDPNDIESISVLKDASATAIYGVRASNGVILIQTKRGAKGKPKVNVSARYGVQNLNKRYDVMNVSQYVDANHEAWANNPSVVPNPDYYKFYDPASPYYLGNSRSYTDDWIDYGLVKNAAIQDYNLGVSGGNERSNYALGTGFSSQEDVVYYSKYDRYSFSLNSDHQLAQWLKVGESFRFAYSKNDQKPGYGSINNKSPLDKAYMAPWQPLYDDGSDDINGYDGWALPGRTIDGTFQSRGYGLGTQSSPGASKYVDYTNVMLRNMGTFYAELSPFTGLRFRGTFSFDHYSYRTENYTRGREVGLYDAIRGTLLSEAEANPFIVRDNINTNIIKEFLVGYNKSIGNHNFDLILNYMDQSVKWDFEQKSITKNSPITNWDQRRIDEGWSAEDKGLLYERKPSGLQGYMGRLSYNFNSKYYIDATVRRDGTSKFGPGYKWGTFPSFAAAWRISAEKFMGKISWLNDLKIRGGWGEVGNQETKDFAFLSLVNFNPKYTLGSLGNGNGTILPAAALGDFPIIDMSWETSTTTNFGFDAILLGNKVAFTAEYYHRLTEGILQVIEIPLVIGASNNPVVNMAKVENKGFEFQLSVNDRIGEVGYNVSANLTTTKNKVMDLYRNTPSGDNYARIEEGRSMNFLYGYKTNGIFQTDADVTQYLEDYDDPGYENQKAPGDVRFVDIHGAPTEEDGEFVYYHGEPDGKIDAYDQTYLGKTIPGFYYGLNLGADYKGWDFSMNFRGVGDVQGINLLGKNSIGAGGGNYDKIYLNRWTPDRHSNTIPRAIEGDPSGNNRISDRHVENRGFLRLQNVQLGYSFNNTFLKKLGASSVRCFVSGSNLFVVSPWTGLDPENDYTPVTYMMGVNLNF